VPALICAAPEVITAAMNDAPATMMNVLPIKANLLQFGFN